MVKVTVDKEGLVQSPSREGSLDVRVPTNFLDVLNFAGNDLNNVGYINSVDITTITGSAIPANVTIVAKAGGQHTTITEALASASSGDVIAVYPGVYQEAALTIPAGVRVVGFPASQNVIISGSSHTGSRIIMQDTSTIREVTIVGPTSGSAPAIDCTGLSAGELAVIYNVPILGGGGSGPLIKGSGNGITALLQVYHNGGITTGPFIENSSGTMVCQTAIASAGVCSDIIRITDGSARFQNILVQDSSLYSCTNLIKAISGSLEISSFSTPSENLPSQTGLHIAGDGIHLSIDSGRIFGIDNDILIDSGLSGTNSRVTLNSVRFRLPKLICSSAIDWPATASCSTSFFDIGENDDESFRVIGEFSVGVPLKPTESSFGTGDSTTKQMLVFTDDGTGTSFINRTTEARTKDSQTFTLQGISAGHTLYAGSELGKFSNIKLQYLTTGSLNTGSVDLQLWDGSTWNSTNYMISDSDYPYRRRAKSIFSGSSEQLRIDFQSSSFGNWIQSNPGMGLDAWWARLRITSPIVASPVFQRIKTGFNRTEIDEDGFIETYGQGQYLVNLTDISLATSLGLAGSAVPGNANLDFAPGITFQTSNNSLGNSDGLGWQRVEIPDNLDTSKKIQLSIYWRPSTTGTGTVQLDLNVISWSVGTVINGTLPTTVISSTTTISTNSLDQIFKSDFSVDVSSNVPDSFFAFALIRNAAGTYVGSVEIVDAKASGIAWHT